jgi:hypothetical protein
MTRCEQKLPETVPEIVSDAANALELESSSALE